MGMISRYKRSGGFVQLLSLIETSGPTKREKFLEIIRSESPHWAEAIQKHSISMDRIFKWDDQVVIEIFKALPLRNMACALKGIPEEHRTRIFTYLSHSEKRKVEDEMGSLNMNPEEFNGTIIKVLEITRKMISEGQIRLERVDPELEIPEEIEEKLQRLESNHASPHMEDKRHDQIQEAVLKVQRSGSASSQEVVNLQRMAQALTRENKSLREENKILKEKLEQIRKIA